MKKLTIQSAVKRIDIEQPLICKKGEVHINCVFPRLDLALAASSPICKDLATLCGYEVTVNVYYLLNRKLKRFKRMYSINRKRPAHVRD